MKKKYALAITTSKDLQPTQDEMIEAIRSVIDKRRQEISKPYRSIKIEVCDDFSKK